MQCRESCALILAEIRRGCAFLEDEAPATIVGNTRDGADAGKGRSPDARSDIRGPLSPARPTRMSLTLHWPTETFAGEGGSAYG